MNALSARGSAERVDSGAIMIPRVLLATAVLAAVGIAPNGSVRAAEAASPLVGDLIGSGLTEAEGTRIAARLKQEGMVVAGDLRRKGDLIVAVAVQQGVPWRLVIHGRSGEIIGRRALVEAVALPR
jgi:hypothetical protein